jgi:hypothetical protein
MLSYIESFTVVLLCVAVALTLTRYLNRRLEDNVRKLANGVNGWQLGILGSIYAVVLGFMLSDAWLAYQTASDDVRNEAAAALTIYRTAVLMPAPCRLPLQGAAGTYLRTVLDAEWPAMEQHHINTQGAPVIRTMWALVEGCATPGVEPARESVIRALESLQERRDARVEDATGHLPVILWGVLLFGGIIVVASSCLLGNEKQAIHCFHVVSLTVLISVTLLAISDLDRPFDGGTRIDPLAFHNAQADMSQQVGH